MKKSIVFVFMLLTCFTCSSFAQPAIDNPVVKWRFKTEGPIRADAVVDGEKVFVSSTDGKLYALSKKDGSRLWKFNARGALVGEPAVHGNTVVVVSRNNKVYALNRTNGRLKWKFRMRPELPVFFSEWRYFSASPVISNGKVYVGSGDGHLYALDQRNGYLHWKFRTEGPIRATPLIAGNTIYQPSDDGFVYALNAETGQYSWKFETAGAQHHSPDHGFDRKAIYTQPILVNDTLIIGSRDGNVYAIDTNTHTAKWNFSYGTTWAMSTAVQGDTVYVGWSTNNHFSAVDLNTGEEKWKFVAGAHNYATPLVGDYSVYFGSADGNLYQLDKTTGEKIWQYNIGKEIFSSPVFDDQSDTLFLGSDDGFLYAIEQGETAYKAVYQPTELHNISQYLIVDARITPYLTESGYEHLDSEAQLQQFIETRLVDGAPSVIVFAFPVVPENVMGDKPWKGMLRDYLESGGKVVWFGDPVNYFAPIGDWELARDATQAEQLLGVKFVDSSESGNYYSKATQLGRNWGLPSWLKTTGAPVAGKGVVPLGYDEFGYVVAWLKSFHPRSGSGFISLRTWAWSVPIQDEDLELIHEVAEYGLE